MENSPTVTSTATFTPEPTATSTPEPTATHAPEPIATSTPVNLTECQLEDVKEEGEKYVSERAGVRKRSLPVPDSDYHGIVNQNTKLLMECTRGSWYRVSDGQGGFWIISDYTSSEPVATATPVPIRTPLPVSEPKTEPAQSPNPPRESAQNHKRAADLIFEGVNRIRLEKGLLPYTPNSILQATAEKHTLLLHQSAFLFDPNTPNPHYIGGSSQSRASAQGYQGAASDIIAWRKTESAESATSLMVYETWLNSSGHYQIMASADYREAGAGCAYGKTYGQPIFICELMVGRP